MQANVSKIHKVISFNIHGLCETERHGAIINLIQMCRNAKLYMG